MSATAFNTHKVAKTLAKAGFTEPQVEAQVDVLSEITSELVTKEHLKHELSSMEYRLTAKVAGIVVFVATAAAAIEKLL